MNELNAECVAEDWHDAAIAVDYRWHLFSNAKTPLDQAEAVVALRDAISDLRTFLPGYDYETGMLPWERDCDGPALTDGKACDA